MRSISLVNASSTTGEATELRLNEFSISGANFVALKAADSVPTSNTLTLPDADGGLNDVLTTDGAENTCFQSPGLPPGTEQTANFTTFKNVLELVDVSSGPVTVTPTASPLRSDRFAVSDSRTKHRPTPSKSVSQAQATTFTAVPMITQ